MNKKIRYSIYFASIVGMLVWWWSIPSQPPSSEPRVFVSDRAKVKLGENITILNMNDISPEMEKRIKDTLKEHQERKRR